MNQMGVNQIVEPSPANSSENSKQENSKQNADENSGVALGLIALIPFRAINPALLAVEAMQSGATLIELTASNYIEAHSPIPPALLGADLLGAAALDGGARDGGALDEGLVTTLVAEVISKTGLPVITSGLDDILLRCAFEAGAIGVWSTQENGSAISIAPGSIAIDPGPLDPSQPAILASNLDRISSLSASGEHVVATILGTTDAEVSIMASLAITRGARTLRTSRVTPASRAALVTDAIRRSL